ncbi:MAG TPA: membrane-bound lytic murein transglycosylase MltF [Thioalkalivibrio sp.]|nr:membrane-bound lytic murein transglycosylase MltF [Thioalkalivibrio sp.]
MYQALSAAQAAGASLRGRFLACLFTLPLLAACSPDTPETGETLDRVATTEVTPESIRAEGELVVITRNAPTTVYQDRDGLGGIEYLLTEALAESLGVPVRYRYFDNVDAVLAAVERGEGHLAAAGLTRTPQRAERYRFGPSYQQIQQQVVCHRQGVVPDSVAELSKVSLLVIDESSYVERLAELRQEYPDLRWQATTRYSTEEIFQRVADGKVDCTVADSNIVMINRRYLPELVAPFAISEEQPLAWVLPEGGEALGVYLQDWFGQIEADGTLARAYHRSYGHIDTFDYVDLRAFKRRLDDRLPQYRRLFEQAAETHGIPWTILAAQAYQESHWEPAARSPTGVRGIMMLTLTTAEEVGVDNRLDPKQSIDGGARYLANLMGRLPEDIPERDRIWFALMAYNVGMGHLYDARSLARRLGKDPNSLVDMKEVLPLLSRKEYYTTLRYGYARGTEPVRYVNRIRDFVDILERHLATGRSA